MKLNSDSQWKTLENVNKWLIQADVKAVGLLAANGVAASMVFTHLGSIVGFLRDQVTAQVFVGLASVLLVASACCAMLCIAPRLAVGEPKSLIFFQHISKITAVDYAKKLKTTPLKEWFDDLAYQTWANSVVAYRKHRLVLWGIRFLIGALISSLIPVAIYVGASL